MKRRIINIIPHPPAYELRFGKIRPEVSWRVSEGRKVCLWPNEWSDQLGNEILKITNVFRYEVWQPDLKADRVYSHTFDNGLIHKLFPAQKKKKMYGLRIKDEICSEALIGDLLNYVDSDRVVVHLNSITPGIVRQVLSLRKRFPIILWHHSEIDFPSTRFFKLNKNFFCKFNLIKDHMWLKKNINKLDHFVHCNRANLGHLIRIYHGRVTQITAGCDFNFWVKLNKKMCRKSLNLPQDIFILLTVTRFVSGKQIDKFIRISKSLSSNYKFLYILIGGGERRYENYLRRVANPLVERGQMSFVGYTTGEKLLRYYNAADLFVSTSASEAGPVTIMEALACGLPVFSTKTGATAELMDGQNTGVLVGTKDYKDWRCELEKIFKSEKLPVVLRRDIAKEYFDWQNIAKNFIAVYKQTANSKV